MNYPHKLLEPAFHLAFWVLLFAFSLSMTGPIFTPEDALAFTLLRVSTLMAVTYIHLWLIIPRLFRKGEMLGYSFSVMGMVALSVLINYSFFELWHPALLRDLPRVLSMRPKGMPFRFGGPFLQIFLTFSTLFFSLVYALWREFQRKEQQTTQIEREKIKYELNFLRSQINPHFLFNALNNLHATVQLQPQQAGDYVLKLGDMLRYVLEDCKKDWVKLSKEIEYIRNYIFFQQKKDSQLQNFQFEVSGEDPAGFEMEPMLLIALVENAFIHGYDDDLTKQYVLIHIHLSEVEMRFFIRNNLPEHDTLNPYHTRQHNIGLNNVKRRLALLYPNMHTFTYGPVQSEYQAEIILHREHL